MTRKYVLKKVGETPARSPIIDESKFHINYREQLNAAQYEAVTAVDGAYLVIAGAGQRKNKNISLSRCKVNRIRLRPLINSPSYIYA